jgi:hypothetical protein
MFTLSATFFWKNRAVFLVLRINWQENGVRNREQHLGHGFNINIQVIFFEKTSSGRKKQIFNAAWQQSVQ